MQNHLEPKMSVLSERHHFLKFIYQESNESVGDFMTRVKDYAEKCQYDALMYEIMTRDIFISGLKEQFRKVLLTSAAETMTAKEALAKAMVEEQALRGNEAMNPVAEVNAVNKKSATSGRFQENDRRFNNKRCDTCTLRGHEAKDCEVSCYVCGKKGHIARRCDKKKNTYKSKKNNKSHMVEEEVISEESGEDQYEYPIHRVVVHDAPLNNIDIEIDDTLLNLNVNVDMNNNLIVLNDSVRGVESTQANHVKVWNDTRGLCEIANKSVSSAVMTSERCVRTLCDYVKGHELVCDCTRGLRGVKDAPVNSTEMSSEGCVSGLREEVKSAEVKRDHVFKSACEYEGGVTCKVNASAGSVKPIVEVMINGVKTPMEVDSGSQVTVMSAETLSELGILVKLCDPGKRFLKTANGSKEQVSGTGRVQVEFRGVSAKLELTVVEGKFETLLGRNWFNRLLGEDWLDRLLGVHQVKSCTRERELRTVEQLKKSKIFTTELGAVEGVEAEIILRTGHQPKYLRSRPLPMAVKEKVIRELEKMEALGIIARVEDSEYATPIVPVVKGTKVRICGDYKTTINQDILYGNYEIPTTEECFAKMAGCRVFCLIDVKKAY